MQGTVHVHFYASTGRLTVITQEESNKDYTGCFIKRVMGLVRRWIASTGPLYGPEAS